MQSVERHFLPPSTSGRCNLNLFLKRVPIADGKKKKNRTGHTILDASFPPTFLSELKNRKEKRKFSNGTRQMASKKKNFRFFFSSSLFPLVIKSFLVFSPSNNKKLRPAGKVNTPMLLVCVDISSAGFLF